MKWEHVVTASDARDRECQILSEVHNKLTKTDSGHT